MNSKGAMNPVAVGGIVVVIALLAGAAYYFTRQQPEAETPPVLDVGTVDINAEISNTTQNPTEDLPQTNPFEASTNPFDSYKNPFDS